MVMIFLSNIISNPLIHGKESLVFASIALCKVFIPMHQYVGATIQKIKLGWYSNVFSKGLVLGVGAAVVATTACVQSCIAISHALPRISIATTFGARLAGLRLVERYIDDPTDAMNTLRILQTMVQTDGHIRKLIAEIGGIEITVKAMRKHADDSEGVAANGSGLLRAVCEYNDGMNDRKIMEHGGISVLVNAMKHWPENEEVQANACMALDLLAANCDIAIRKKIIDVGGLVILAEARTKHQHDIRISVPAAHAIIELVARDKELLK